MASKSYSHNINFTVVAFLSNYEKSFTLAVEIPMFIEQICYKDFAIIV